MTSMTYWELALGFVAFLSLGLNIHQMLKRRGYQNQAVGCFSQLWDIIVEIDSARVTEIPEMKRLVNQVRIQLIALNDSLGSPDRVIRPWQFGTIASRKRHETDVAWAKKKVILQAELEDLEQKKTTLEQELKNQEASE